MSSRKHPENSVNKLQIAVRKFSSALANFSVPLPVEIGSIYSEGFLDKTRGIWAICSHDSMLDPYYWLAALTQAEVLDDRIVAAPIAIHQRQRMGPIIDLLKFAVGGVELPLYTQNSRKGKAEEVDRLRANYVRVARQTLSEPTLGVVPVAAMAKRGLIEVTRPVVQRPMRFLAENNIGDPNIVFLATHVGEKGWFRARKRRIMVSGPVLFSELIAASRGITRVDNLARCVIAINGGDNRISRGEIHRAMEAVDGYFGSDRSRTILTRG